MYGKVFDGGDRFVINRIVTLKAFNKFNGKPTCKKGILTIGSPDLCPIAGRGIYLCLVTTG
jgi:hypothetical protein